MLSNLRHIEFQWLSVIYVLVFMLAFPPFVFAQLTIVDYGLCRVEGQSKQAMVGDSPEGVLSAAEISIIEKTNMITATQGTCFGVQFTAPLEDSENLGLEARIYHPPIKLKNGLVKESTELPLFIFTDKPSFVGWRFNSPNELVSGDWVIEFTNDIKILARQRFMVQATSMASEAAMEDPAPEQTQPYVEDEPSGYVSPEPTPDPEPMTESEMVAELAPVPAPSMDTPDHPADVVESKPKATYEFTGEWETITRYLVQVAAHSKHDNMIAFEQKLKGMGLSPFSFVGPCNCPYKDLYLTFVNISSSREAAAEYARSVTETYGIDAFVKPIRAVVPAGWPQD